LYKLLHLSDADDMQCVRVLSASLDAMSRHRIDAADSDGERERTAPLVECLWTCLHALIDATASLRLTQFVPAAHKPDPAVTKAAGRLMATSAFKRDPVLNACSSASSNTCCRCSSASSRRCWRASMARIRSRA
jgi:hypothetical protein